MVWGEKDMLPEAARRQRQADRQASAACLAAIAAMACCGSCRAVAVCLCFLLYYWQLKPAA